MEAAQSITPPVKEILFIAPEEINSYAEEPTIKTETEIESDCDSSLAEANASHTDDDIKKSTKSEVSDFAARLVDKDCLENKMCSSSFERLNENEEDNFVNNSSNSSSPCNYVIKVEPLDVRSQCEDSDDLNLPENIFIVHGTNIAGSDEPPPLVCIRNRVSYILKKDFAKLPLEERMIIKTLGRPTPVINLTQTDVHKAENRSFTRRFSKDMYNKHKWLCGCDVLNALFCFPCLLFYTDGMDKTWSRAGFKDLKHLSDKLRKHEASLRHIHSCMELALLGNVNIMDQLNSAYREEIVRHNEQVERNRHILKRIINCVKFYSSFELGLSGHDEKDDSKNRGIFKELIDFTSDLDFAMKEHLKTATVFKGTSKIVQNDILDCMLTVCRDEIKKQIDDTDFVAIQCDETTDVSNHCQMVLVLRYLHEGLICERFWSFLRVTDKTVEGLKSCIEREIDPIMLKSPGKLIAQTYDGASVMSGSIAGVQVKIRQKYPSAHFMHCYAHQLNLLMQKAAGQNAKVRVFFSDLSSIPAFFSNSTHRCDVLEKILRIKLPKVAITRWCYNIHTVNTVFENREKLIECFEEIEERCEKSVTSKEACGLRRALQDPDFLFWLTLFHRILPHVDILFHQFHSRDKDSVQLLKDIAVFERSISNIRNATDKIAVKIENDNCFNNPKKRKTHNDFRNSVIAKQVCDAVTTQLKDRFSYRGHLEAASLLDHEMFPAFSKSFPNKILNSVVVFYPVLGKIKLKTELEVIYMRKDFRKVVGAMNILSLMLKNNLEEAFSETIKLLKIIITTPMSTPETERCFSTLQRIKTFLRNTKTSDRLNALAMMSINKNLVHNITDFDNKVIEKFISVKDRRMDFTFKK